MNRYAYNNNAISADARMPAPIAARMVDFDRLAQGETLMNILLRPFKCGKIARELRMLDERMLFDDLLNFRLTLRFRWIRDFLPVVDAAFDEDRERCGSNSPVAAR